ncbi:MAG TPA: ABC transporter substrate-binding protein, partial [Myxococcaceae bacterium]|nr:ABC transporter substrate-binding protein [Myxococcaceae bacterium]
TTLWSDHPVSVLEASWVSPAQRAAARTYVAHLRSRPVQEQALAMGFRPGDNAVKLKTQDPRNPFTRLSQYGIQVDIPTAANAPDPAVVRNLMTLWSRTIGVR